MSPKVQASGWRAVLFVLLLAVCVPLLARQNSGPAQDSPAGGQASSQQDNQPNKPDQPNAQESPPAAPPASENPAVPAQNNPPGQSAPTAQAPSQQPPAQTNSDSGKGAAKAKLGDQVYNLTTSYFVTLSADWDASSKGEIPPPAPLSPYAPPFHLSGNLVLMNSQRGAILQFATSDNPFIGHDAYWLDTQMHSPSGTDMSLLDFFFYYFFPPSDACMHQILTTYAPASRVSPTEGPAYMQVYYSCPLSDTLSGFYAAQVSSGITFQQTDNGTRVLAPVGDFYVAPMEQIEESDMTFFIFEAQGMNSVSSDAAQRFHLPETATGGQPDFFRAIGAASPFPFVADTGRKDAAILHVAYARLGVDSDARTEFMNILHEIHTRQ